MGNRQLAVTSASVPSHHFVHELIGGRFQYAAIIIEQLPRLEPDPAGWKQGGGQVRIHTREILEVVCQPEAPNKTFIRRGRMFPVIFTFKIFTFELGDEFFVLGCQVGEFPAALNELLVFRGACVNP